MSFKMRMPFVDVICDDSLRSIYANNRKIGYEFLIRLAYYRGHYLSDIDVLEVYVDGEQVKEDRIRLAIGEKEYSVCQLKYCFNEFWPILEPAKIRVLQAGGLEEGEHKIEVKLILRVPYMSIGPGKYMPLDSSGEKVLVLNN